MSHRGVANRADVSVGKKKTISFLPLGIFGVVFKNFKIKCSKNIRHSKWTCGVPAPRREKHFYNILADFIGFFFKLSNIHNYYFLKAASTQILQSPPWSIPCNFFSNLFIVGKTSSTLLTISNTLNSGPSKFIFFFMESIISAQKSPYKMKGLWWP